ncbi:MAG TPA: hypothetical protein VIH21_00160 [Dehalococcoidia bacterium]
MTATVAEAQTTEHRRSASDGLARALEFDFAQPLAFLALAAAYLLSRLPFINIGYGTDPDSWRVALTGYWLWDHHEYYPSRLPGYPIPELASAAVIKGGWLATNMLTVLISLAGLWFFARIVAKLDVPNRAVLVVAFAFTPLLWINSMTTMDYMWALTFMLASYYFLIGRNVAVAGIMLGLAVGSRSTSIAMVLPFAVYLWRDGRKDEIRSFVVAMLGVAILAWAPIYWKYGPSMFNFYDSKVGYLAVLRLLGKDCLGLIGSIAVLAAIIVSLPRLARLPMDALHDKHVDVWLLAIIVTAITFARLPHEAAYLIPIYPFGLLLMGRYFQKWALAGAVGVIVLAGFVDLTSPGDEINGEAFTHARLGRGLVLSNRDTMLAQRSFVRELGKQEFADRSVVAIGFVYPQFAVQNRNRFEVGMLEKDRGSISQLSDKGKLEDKEHDIIYVWLLDYKNFTRYKALTYNYRYTQDAGRSTVALYDYRPGLLGGTIIDLGRTPSGGSGAARTDR